MIIDSRFWFTNASILSLTNKIIGLLKNPDLLQTAGKKNKQTAERNYAWEDIAKKTEYIYQLNEKAHELKLKTV